MIEMIRWSSDGQRILTGSRDRTAILWDVPKARLLVLLKGQPYPVSFVDFHPQGERLLTGSTADFVHIWHPDNGLELLRLKKMGAAVFRPDGKQLLGFQYKTHVHILDATKKQTQFRLRGSRAASAGEITQLAFTPDSTQLFAWSKSGDVFAWSMLTGQAIDPIDPPPPQTGPLRSPNGFLTARSSENDVIVVDHRLVNPNENHWPFPDAAGRKHYHTQQAALTEKQKAPFAVAFHLSRLLMDEPNNPDFKRRRDAALDQHAKTQAAQSPEP